MLGVSDADLMRESGISRTAILRIHAGKDPFKTHEGVASDLARALGVEVEEISWPNGLTHLGRPPHTGTSITVNVNIKTSQPVCRQCFIELPLVGGCPTCD